MYRLSLKRGRTLRIGVTTLVVAGAMASPASAARWRPPPRNAYFQYQLQASSAPSRTGGIATGICAKAVGGSRCVRPSIFDIDLYGPDGKTPNRLAVRAITSAGGYTICYVDAGTYESWRPDARRFARDLLGRANGWPGERWLDVRHATILLAIMAPRIAACAAAGFRAVEFDNVDGYANDTGFKITSVDQLRYNRALARLAHRYGLAAGLKNDYGQVAALEGIFDFAIDEQCLDYRECTLLEAFVHARKAVYDVEYGPVSARACAVARALGVNVIEKSRALRAQPWLPCPVP